MALFLNNVMAAALAAQKRKQSQNYIPGDAALPIPNRFNPPDLFPAPVSTPMTSQYQPGEPTVTAPGPQDYTGLGLPTPAGTPAPAAPVKAGGMSEQTRAMLGAALQGASAGIRADVGPARPGSGFSQGILKGIVGAGAVQADRERAAAAGAAADRSLSEKIALLQMRKESPSEAAAKAAAVAGAEQPYKIELQNAGAAVRERIAKAVKDNANGLTTWQGIQLNNMVQDQVDARFKTAYNFNPSDEELQKMITTVKSQMVSGPKVIVKPVLP